jgi:hypothetical protein
MSVPRACREATRHFRISSTARMLKHRMDTAAMSQEHAETPRRTLFWRTVGQKRFLLEQPAQMVRVAQNPSRVQDLRDPIVGEPAAF